MRRKRSYKWSKRTVKKKKAVTAPSPHFHGSSVYNAAYLQGLSLVVPNKVFPLQFFNGTIVPCVLLRLYTNLAKCRVAGQIGVIFADPDVPRSK